MALRIELLTPANAAAWDGFVAGQPSATFFHQAAMPGLLARVFGHRDRSLLALQDGAVMGVLPLVEVRTRLFGHSLISLPFCVYAGPLAAEPQAAGALLAHAEGLRERSRASALELRTLRPLPDDWFPEPEAWPIRSGLYATFRKDLEGSEEAAMKAIPRKQRAMVRKGIERGLQAETIPAGRVAGIETVHRIYAESVRNLGTPVFPRRWFRGLFDSFPGAVDAVLIRDPQGGQAPVAGVVNFHWRDEVLPYYGGGTAAARACHAYDFMYWEVMRQALARGARLFDFGRSKEGTGAYAFKKNWGFVPQPLAYRFRLKPGAAIPENNPLNPKYRLMIAAWKRLPLPVAGLIGPRLIRGLG